MPMYVGGCLVHIVGTLLHYLCSIIHSNRNNNGKECMLLSPHSYKHCGVTVVMINNIVLCPIELIVVHI